MAILRSDEIRDMSTEDMKEKLNDLQMELAKENGKIEVGGFPDNEGRIKEIKRTIARIKTIMNEQRRNND